MIDHEHLALIMQGADAWNAWRWERRGLQPHLYGAVLAHSALRGIDLSHLSYVAEDYPDLDATDFHEADLQNASFQSAHVNLANFRNANLRHSNFGWASLSGSDLSGADLSWAEFNGADLDGAYLRNANVSHVMLPNANMGSANLRGADLSHSDLHKSDLQKALLHFAHLRDADLKNADLRDAVLLGADLRNANLQYANLSNADLTGADLTGADLRYATLHMSLLRDTDFSYARLGWNIFGDHDLRTVKGLETIQHFAPSSLSINTLILSRGQIPDAFLRGTGVPDAFLELIHKMSGADLLSYAPTNEVPYQREAMYRACIRDYVADPTDADIAQETKEEIWLMISDYKRKGRPRAEARKDAGLCSQNYPLTHNREWWTDNWLSEEVDRVLEELYGAEEHHDGRR